MNRALPPFLRRNAIGLLALFVALGGTSYAAVSLPKNSVGSAQIKPRAVTASDIKTNAITSSKVKPGSLLSSDFKSGVLPKTATGAAGGALSGSYPNPQLADGSVTEGKIAAGAVTGSKLAPGSVTASTLGKLPAVRLKLTATGDTQSVPDGPGNTGIVFPTTQYNNSGLFTTATESTSGATALKIPVSGVYAVSAEVLWVVPATTADNGTGYRSLFLSGPQPGGVRAGSTVQAVTGTATRQPLAVTEYFNAGDEIFLTASQNSGAALNIRQSQNQLHFSATLLTP